MDSEKISIRITTSDRLVKVISDPLKTRATTTQHRAEPQVAFNEPQIDIAIIEESDQHEQKINRSIASPKKPAGRVLNFEENYSSEMEENRSGFQSIINKVPQVDNSIYFSFRNSTVISPSNSFLCSDRSEYWSMLKAADLCSSFELQRELDMSDPGAVIVLPNREFEVSGLTIRKSVTLKGLKNTKLVLADSVLIQAGEGAVISVTNMLIDSNKFEKSSTSGFKSVNLFVVTSSAALCFRDCRIEGCRNLCLVSADCLSSLTLESCHIKSLKQLGTKGTQVLRVHNCFFEQFSSRVLALGALQEAAIIQTTFLDNAGGCIQLVVKDTEKKVKLSIEQCNFANNPGTAIEVKGTRLQSCEVTVGIFGCSFKESPRSQIVLTQGVFKVCSIEDCKFEKISGKCISLTQVRKFSVSKCEFGRFEDEAIAVTGGNGKVENCSMSVGETGVRVIGDSPLQDRQPKEPGQSSSRSRRSEALAHPVIQVTRSRFSGMRQAAVEVSDTLHLDFLLEACTIDRGVTGVLIRDVQQDVRLDTSTAHAEPKADIHATFVDLRAAGNSAVSESGRLLLLDNIITNNLGSGIKIENPGNPVFIEGGEIIGNRDHSIGVVGSLQKHLVLGVAAKHPKLDRKVEEIDFGIAQEKSNPCTLI